MRLRDARLFGRRGSILGKRESGFWSTLLDNVADQECTPLLGPGVTAGLLPDPRQVALDLAREHVYPFADGERLSRVAQYVGTIDNRSLRKSIVRRLTYGFLRRIGRTPQREDRRAGLSRTVAAVDWSRLIRRLEEVEVHHQLADLDLPLYLTTNFDNFLTRVRAEPAPVGFRLELLSTEAAEPAILRPAREAGVEFSAGWLLMLSGRTRRRGAACPTHGRGTRLDSRTKDRQL